jgi:putative endonuclease
MYFVYLLQCSDNSIYTGITNDLERRFAEHKKKKAGDIPAPIKLKK